MPNWSAAKTAPKKAIPYSTTDYLELVDWSSRAIIEGKKGAIPDHLPPILQRLSINPGQYLNFIRKPGSVLLIVLGALDKIRECADYFQKAFLKGQTKAAALFSPGQ